MSINTVSKYLDILEQTFAAFRIYSYSNNLGNELKKSCKIYLYDVGIRNSLLKNFSSLKDRQDRGAVVEGMVYLKLQQMMKPNMDLKFWRTKDGAEVDFIVLKNRKPTAIEVKSADTVQNVPPGLKKYLTRYPATRQAFVVTLQGKQQTVTEGECQIRYVPLEAFMLGNDWFEEGD